MANGKKPKKGIQLGPDVKKAMNIAAEVLVGPTYETAKGVYNYLNPSKPIGDLNSAARRAKEIFTEGVGGKGAAAGAKAGSRAGSRTGAGAGAKAGAKAGSRAGAVKTEKIYDLGVLPEHEVVASKGDDKGRFKQSIKGEDKGLFKQSIKEFKRPNRAFKEIKKSTGSQGAENTKKAPIIPVKNALENRSDLKRNSAAMMKVKNPQKKY